MPLYDQANPITSPNLELPNPINSASSYLYPTQSEKVISDISGDSFVVTYYSKIIGVNDSNIDTNDPTLQQYHKIERFELRLDSSFSLSNNTDFNTNNITASANVYPFIIPNVNDKFVFDANGDTLICLVTSAVRQSNYSQACYKIEFNLFEFATAEKLQLLEDKVVTISVFDPDMVNHFDGPIINIDQYNNSIYTRELIKDLIDYYHQKFFSIAFNTFLVPDDLGLIVFDNYVVKFWNFLIGGRLDDANHTKPIDYDFDNYLFDNPVETVYDMLIKNNILMIPRLVKYLEPWSVMLFNAQYIQRTAVTIGFDKIVVPKDISNKKPITNIIVDSLSLPYVLSKDFYLTKTPTTLLELQILKYLRKEILSYRDVHQLAKDVLLDTDLNQFYFIPIVIGLLTQAR